MLSSPDATPASRPVTPDSAPIDTGTKANAVPTPPTKNGPARSCQKFPPAGACAAHRIEPPISSIPNDIALLTEVRVTIRCESPGAASANEVTDAPAIYRIAESPAGGAAFHDITTGDNTIEDPPVTITGYQASRGWDPVTGWGSPNAQVLVPLLAR